MTTDSPCIGVCRLIDYEMTCAGCYRTMHEIAAWHRLTEAEKLRVLAGIAERRIAQASETAASRTE